MILTDVHTHTKFSSDGRGEIRDMIERAIALGLSYYGISEHVNYDYDEIGITIQGIGHAIDLPAYFTRARALQAEYADRIRVLAGCELGYNPAENCCRKYRDLIARYRPDFVVNSIHTCMGKECYFPEYTQGTDKREAYGAYFDAVLQSLSAPYPYDIVAHIGYCSRNAVYADPKIRYGEYSDRLDAILQTVVDQNKILEVNSSARSAGSLFLPDTDILTRYYKLGGRKVSFASDAHDTDRVADKRELVVAALKKIGFTHLTVPDCGKHLTIPLE